MPGCTPTTALDLRRWLVSRSAGTLVHDDPSDGATIVPRSRRRPVGASRAARGRASQRPGTPAGKGSTPARPTSQKRRAPGGTGHGPSDLPFRQVAFRPMSSMLTARPSADEVVDRSGRRAAGRHRVRDARSRGKVRRRCARRTSGVPFSPRPGRHGRERGTGRGSDVADDQAGPAAGTGCRIEVATDAGLLLGGQVRACDVQGAQSVGERAQQGPLRGFGDRSHPGQVLSSVRRSRTKQTSTAKTERSVRPTSCARWFVVRPLCSAMMMLWARSASTAISAVGR